jgi:uncharacterized protein (DUF697 family)
MDASQKEKCQVIIHGAATAGAAVGGGMAQLPGSDNVVLAGIEVTMAIGLAQVFNISLEKSAAEGLIAGFVGTIGGRAISQFLIGWIPGIGNFTNAATAAGMIEAMGWTIANHFDKESQKNN